MITAQAGPPPAQTESHLSGTYFAVFSGPNYCFELLREKGPDTKCVGNSVQEAEIKRFIFGLQSLIRVEEQLWKQT